MQVLDFYVNKSEIEVKAKVTSHLEDKGYSEVFAPVRNNQYRLAFTMNQRGLVLLVFAPDNVTWIKEDIVKALGEYWIDCPGNVQERFVGAYL